MLVEEVTWQRQRQLQELHEVWLHSGGCQFDPSVCLNPLLKPSEAPACDFPRHHRRGQHAGSDERRIPVPHLVAVWYDRMQLRWLVEASGDRLQAAHGFGASDDKIQLWHLFEAADDKMERLFSVGVCDHGMQPSDLHQASQHRM